MADTTDPEVDVEPSTPLQVFAAIDSDSLAIFPAKIQNKYVKCLWDTGATTSLVSHRLISRLGLVDKIYKIPLQVVKGLADATVQITQAIQLNVVFNDGADRWIDCLVCSEIPYELLLGLPFMMKHSVSFVPQDNEFHLVDSVVERVISTTSGLTGKPSLFVIQQSGEKSEKLDQGHVFTLKHPERLHPTLQTAFNCRLTEGVNLDSILNALIASDQFEIDISQLGEKRDEILGNHAAHFNSQVLTPEQTPDKGYEKIDLSFKDLLQENTKTDEFFFTTSQHTSRSRV